MVKEFLSQQGVPFTVRDVRSDAAARATLRRLGALLPPVTVIGSEVVVGFQPERLEALLDAWAAQETPSDLDRLD